MKSEMQQIFSYWGDTQKFVHAIQKDAGEKRRARQKAQTLSMEWSFADLAEVAEIVGDQFGAFVQENICKDLKSKLMKMEHRKSGRVKLSEFYKPALDGVWQFQESPAYLREIGALEESGQQEPRVMIANYMASPSNCIAASGFYSVCCRNACEDLLGNLERTLAANGTKPGIIAALVAFMPSSSSRAPGALPRTLRRRLDEIAELHEGIVPLHSRLFAQWMHHAYPRECPYPHLSGTTGTQTPEEWLEGGQITASNEEMLLYSQWNDTDTSEDLMTWSTEEELPLRQPEEELLVIKPPIASEDAPSPWNSSTQAGSVKRNIALFAVAVSFAYALMQTMKQMRHSMDEKSEKYFV